MNGRRKKHSDNFEIRINLCWMWSFGVLSEMGPPLEKHETISFYFLFDSVYSGFILVTFSKVHFIMIVARTIFLS